jgi:hypothetical protein
MVEASEREAINKGMRILWFFWAAMLVTLLMYMFTSHQPDVGFKNTGGHNLPIGLLRMILAALGVFALIRAYFLRRSMLTVRAGLPKARLVERILNVPPFMAKYAAAVIISLALSDSIGIYGLVLFLLGDSFQTLYTFIGVSALAMIFYRPKREELERLTMAYKQASEISH